MYRMYGSRTPKVGALGETGIQYLLYINEMDRKIWQKWFFFSTTAWMQEVEYQK
jgi:hypothetical protein